MTGLVLKQVGKHQWLLYPHCKKGSVQNDGIILPPPKTFRDIDGLPDGIACLYDEARASFGAQAYTGCEMLCRKILFSDKRGELNVPSARHGGVLDKSVVVLVTYNYL